MPNLSIAIYESLDTFKELWYSRVMDLVTIEVPMIIARAWDGATWLCPGIAFSILFVIGFPAVMSWIKNDKRQEDSHTD